jgi:hypothetical protein
MLLIFSEKSYDGLITYEMIVIQYECSFCGFLPHFLRVKENLVKDAFPVRRQFCSLCEAGVVIFEVGSR